MHHAAQAGAALVSGFPRWIRRDTGSDADARSTANIWASISGGNVPHSMPNGLQVNTGALPSERQALSGHPRLTREIVGVGGTGGEHYTKP